MPAGFHEFRVVLRHNRPVSTGTGEQRFFIAIVSAQDEKGATAEAEMLVKTLRNRVSIVSIEPRPDGFFPRG